MIALLSGGQTALIIVLSILVPAILIVGFFLLYHFVFSRNIYRRQIKDLDRKYSYLDALLIGQDSQFINRLEVVSHTNLLYVEKHNLYSRRFKDIYEGHDKYCESMIKQLKALAANNQFKNIKNVINETRSAIASFEELVTRLDAELYELIKPEEEARQTVLKLKENYRRVKQIYHANSNDLELVASSINAVFNKLDNYFNKFEELIESGEYDEAVAIIPIATNVVNALSTALSALPNLCILITSIVPNRIDEIVTEYKKVESQGVPLFNLSFKNRLDNWNARLEKCKKNVCNLFTNGVLDELNQILDDIETTKKLLYKELTDEEEFNANSVDLERKSSELQKNYLKIVALLPNIRQAYLVDEEHEKEIEKLNSDINQLGNSQRGLNNYIHSGTKQPYSVLKSKLDDVSRDYENCHKGLQDFKAYIDLLRNSTEQAYSMVFLYYHHCKQSEAILRQIDIPNFTQQYMDRISECYSLLNEIDASLKIKPIDVTFINERAEQLKMIGNNLFDEVDTMNRECQLAESSVVYCNRDRCQQADVKQQLNILEHRFFEGEFKSVYEDATSIYHHSHVEEAKTNGRK